MTSILIHNTNNKFIQNCLSIHTDNVSMIDITINNNLYQTFFRHRPQVCIFDANYITEEILQFCGDHGQQTSIFFLHTASDTESLRTSAGLSFIKHIGYDNGYDIVIPTDIINTQLFINNPGHKRVRGCVCFLEHRIPSQELINVLYPNTQLPIKLFNSANFRHYQNLGIVNEKDKARLLQTHTHYLDLDYPIHTNYRLEALACGCIPTSVSLLYDLNTANNSTPDALQHIDNNTYISFIEKNLIL